MTKTRSLTMTALFVVLLALSAQIILPFPTIPMTLQLTVCIVVALTLEPKYACTAIFIYVVMGLLGVPIFAGFSGGFGKLMSPSFGYIIGMVPCIAIVSCACRNKKPAVRLLGLIAGIAFCYILGCGYQYLILKFVLNYDSVAIIASYATLPIMIAKDIVLAILAFAALRNTKSLSRRLD